MCCAWLRMLGRAGGQEASWGNIGEPQACSHIKVAARRQIASGSCVVKTLSLADLCRRPNPDL